MSRARGCRGPLALASLALVLGAVGVSSLVVAGPVTERVEEVRFDLDRLQVETVDSASKGGVSQEVVVRYPGAVFAPAGAPDLPRQVIWVEVPAGMRVRAVRGEPWGVEPMGVVRVRPVPTEARVGEAPPEIRPDAAIYDASGVYPRSWAVLGTEGSLRGHWVVGLWVSPVRWEPATGRLERAAGVRVVLELEPGDSGREVLARHRVVPEIEERFEAGAKRMIRGFQPAAAVGKATGEDTETGTGPAGPGPYQPTFRPTTDGSAVPYVIVTSAALEAEFRRLANWKTQKGKQGVVRTIEWIEQTYPNGVDRAERIRFFIRDAYQNWGTLFVLLGGDTDIVPPRYGETVFFGGESIPSDYYYGCLDGNWNADGDDRFGEANTSDVDNTDLIFDVTIGRAPVSTLAQATTFVDKTLLYEINAPASARYPASGVFLAERLFPTVHGADIAEQAIAFLPPWFQSRVVRLYEESEDYPGSIELTRQVAIDSMDAGFGIIHHVGHGFRNTMSVGAGTLNNTDADNLVNSPRNSVVFAINCSSTSIDFNSIGERFVKNANGGSIAYIGTSRLSFVSPAVIYQNAWYEAVFADSVASLGLATDMARAILLPGSGNDGPDRWNLMATTLLGDPETDIYLGPIVPLQISHPGSVPLGAGPVTVTVDAQGTDVPGASVTLWRENDAYVPGTTLGNGTVQLPVRPFQTPSPPPVIVTVHKTYYRATTGVITLTTTANPFLFVQSSLVDDDTSGSSDGDGDGMTDAGERIELRVTLKNGGGAQATGVNGVLTAADPEGALTILQNTVSYGTLGPGGSSQGGGAFVISIDPTAPVAYQPILTVTATGDQGSWADVLPLPIRRPYLEHYSHVFDDAPPRGNGDGGVDEDEEIWYRVRLRNDGLDQATSVTGILRVLRTPDHIPHPDVTVGDSTSIFGTIAPGGQVEGDRFAFTLDLDADPATVLLQLILNDDLGQLETQFLDVVPPAPTDSLTVFGEPTLLRVRWAPPASGDTKGYDILRSSSPGGPFTRINTYTVDGSAAYEDRNLPPLTRFYYQVVTRDQSYNTSTPSAVISGSTNPPFSAGWPLELGQQSTSSPIIADIDGGNHTEILAGAEMQYAWHGDGTEVVNGDGDDRTSGPFSLWGKRSNGFPATPAIGDVSADGDVEVANIGFSAESVYVWDHQGILTSGWPKWVHDDFNWGSVVLADVDQDSNHDLEVIAWAAKGGRLFAWHHNGVELVDGDNDPSTNGVLAHITANSPNFNYGSPAVGNLDGDPQLEIVVPVNKSTNNSGGVYAFNINGTPVPGWPFFTGDGGTIQSEVSSSPAIGDLDNNLTEEIVFACERGGGSVYVMNRNGTVATGWPKTVTAATQTARLPSPVLADLNEDTFLDVIYIDTSGALWAWNGLGNQLPGFPVQWATFSNNQRTQSTPAIGDFDSTPGLEIVFGDESGKVHAYNHDGTLVNGFPIQLSGEVRGTPSLWDLDRDNLLELAVVAYDYNVYVWDLPVDFKPERLPWPFFRHDIHNTGRIATPVQIGIEEPVTAPGAVTVAAFHPVKPNPFNPLARLAFDVPGESGGARPVKLEIFDVSGRLVRQLINGPVETGRHSMTWDGRGANGRLSASGVYFAKIEIGNFVATQKMTMLR